MASVQSTLTFAVRKKTSLRTSLAKLSGKENLNRGSLNLLTSPLKSGLRLGNVSPIKTPCKSPVTSPQKSPVKRRSSGGDEATPPKFDPLSPKKSPSQLIQNISLDSSKKKPQRSAQKELFPSGSKLSKARQALHSSTPCTLPEREDKLEALKQTLYKNLEDHTSATLYISGAPGTGKTACISTLLADQKIRSGYKVVYVNCTGLKSSGSVYLRIAKALGLGATSEKASTIAIEKYLRAATKMTLLVLDEIDQLESRSQRVLYRIFEWPSLGKMVLAGVANSLDLTTRALPRLANLPPPSLYHFAPYTKAQIATIIEHRLKQAGISEILSGGALQLLAGKVASVSGDVRRALDLARRVIDVSNQGSVSLKDVMRVVSDVYSTSESLASCEGSDPYPLQQKLLVSSLLLLKRHSKAKEVTIGKLHDVYRKVCEKRNLSSVELSEFLSLVQLVETRGVLRLIGKTKNRLTKVVMQWDEQEVSSALQDKQLIADILNDISCLPR